MRPDSSSAAISAARVVRRGREPRPRRVVQQQRRHGRAQPERRTSSAASRSTRRSPRRMRSASALRRCGDVGPLRAQLRELRVRAEDHQLAQLDALVPELVAQLIQRRPHGRRLGDRMSGVLGRNAAQCNTGVAPLRERTAPVRAVWTAARRLRAAKVEFVNHELTNSTVAWHSSGNVPRSGARVDLFVLGTSNSTLARESSANAPARRRIRRGAVVTASLICRSSPAPGTPAARHQRRATRKPASGGESGSTSVSVAKAAPAVASTGTERRLPGASGPSGKGATSVAVR